MKPVTSSIIAGLAGKVSLVVGVLGLGVGTAAAAGADVPLISPPAPTVESVTSIDDTEVPSSDASSETASVDVNPGAAVSEFARTTELEGCAKGQAVAELASGGNHEARACGDESSDDDSSATTADSASATAAEPVTEPSGESSSDENHGQVVSEFARTTELEGCAKGQAVAELASGGNHVAKDCGAAEESSTDDGPEITVAAPTADAPAATSPGNSGEAPGRSGDAPGRSGEAPKGGNGSNGSNGSKNGNGRSGR